MRDEPLPCTWLSPCPLLCFVFGGPCFGPWHTTPLTLSKPPEKILPGLFAIWLVSSTGEQSATILVAAALPITALTALSKSSLGEEVGAVHTPAHQCRACKRPPFMVFHSCIAQGPKVTFTANGMKAYTMRACMHAALSRHACPFCFPPPSQVQRQLEAKLPELQAEAQALAAEHAEARTRSDWCVRGGVCSGVCRARAQAMAA